MSASVQTSVTLPRELRRSELVQCWGGPASTALFDPAIEIFRANGIDGVIPYRHGLGCAVAIGDPIAPREQMGRLANAFRATCRKLGRHTIYAVASDAFATWACAQGYAVVEVGRELVMDPTCDPLAAPQASVLRRRVHRAAREGVTAREYTPYDARLEHALAVAARSADLFGSRPCKRWFYATCGEAVVGVLELVRIEPHHGYLLSRLAWTPDAPPGTTELLVVEALRTLGAQGCTYATWGPAPLDDVGEVEHLGALSEKLGRAVFHATARAFHFTSRNRYRTKFPIARTAGAYLLCDPPKIGMRAALQVLRTYRASTHA